MEKNLKIGLITLHRAKNYGSVLQALATQKELESQGLQVEMIDYYPERYSTLGFLKRLKNKIRHISKNTVVVFMCQSVAALSYIKRKIVFERFIKSKLNLTDKVYRNNADFNVSPPLADMYCTGSDQVWNNDFNEGVDYPLYLSFVPAGIKKISYASSFGKNALKQAEVEKTKNLLKEYAFISVREKQGLQILKSLEIGTAYNVLDPTLLFDGEWWSKYTSKKYYNKKYIVTYNIHHDKKLDKYAETISKKYNLPLYNITYNYPVFHKSGKLMWCPQVEDYLSLIKYSQFVIADSFHAVAFSLIFQKKFAVVLPLEAHERISNILDIVQLEDRVMQHESDDKFNKDINFNSVNILLEHERKKSKDFIALALQR